MEFADRLNQLIDESGITAYKLAKVLPCHSSTVKHWRIGKTKPKPLFLDAMAAYFKVNRLWLEKGQGDKIIKNRPPDNDLEFCKGRIVFLEGIITNLQDQIRILQGPLGQKSKKEEASSE